MIEVRAVIAREPDRGLNAFASLGPRLMIPFEALAETGLVQPGSLLTWEYRLRLPAGVSDVATTGALKARAFPMPAGVCAASMTRAAAFDCGSTD